MKEAYCSYEICKLLKEKGFEEEYAGRYFPHHNDDGTGELYYPPTHQLVCAWLREKGIDIVVKPEYSTEAEPRVDFFVGYSSDIYVNEKAVLVEEITLKIEKEYGYVPYDSYEETIEAALKYTLENLI